jgi:amino acid permease
LPHYVSQGSETLQVTVESPFPVHGAYAGQVLKLLFSHFFGYAGGLNQFDNGDAACHGNHNGDHHEAQFDFNLHFVAPLLFVLIRHNLTEDILPFLEHFVKQTGEVIY